MKVIVIGANHAGTSFVRSLTNLDKKVEIVAYDRNENISFLGCGIALWVGGEFEDPKGLFYSTPSRLKHLGADVKMEHEVVEINEIEKYVIVRDLKSGNEFRDKYDKLVYAAGTWPIVPPFENVGLEGIFISKLFQHAQAIREKAASQEVKNVVVIGAGYIGVELAEAFKKYNKNVTLIDLATRVVPNYFDKEFTEPLELLMKNEGVKLALNEKVIKFEGKNGKVTHVVTNKGSHKADIVIMSVGFRPRTALLKGKVDMLESGAIVVNNRMQTSNKDIYALGDAIAVFHNVLKKPMHIALATNAVKTGLVAAFNVSGTPLTFPGAQGTNGISVFGAQYAATGISEEFAKKQGIKHGVVFHKDLDRSHFMKSAEEVQIKFIYEPGTLKLLGAQIGSFGKTNHSEVVYAMSLAIQQGLTLPEIALMDVYFLPHYNKPFNFMLVPILKVLGFDFVNIED